MKIYNKKKFASGVFLLLLGLFRFTPFFAGRGWDARDIFWAVVAFLLGVSELTHSLSYTLTKKDRLEDLDERNRLIDWKAKSMTLKIAQSIYLVLGGIFLLAGILFAVLSLFIPGEWSVISGVVAFSSFWSILELFQQEKRVKKGWFPENPARKRKA